ncbi:hypothetical protein ACF064_01610 [Streptomyces sp. NPDC015492]|uniref:hypothetical protein n=1 Tax=Streptomyces sp. NPDC015492 TaxID=3364958 RepID=UPI0036FA9418
MGGLRKELRTPFEGSAAPAKRLVLGSARLVAHGVGWIVTVPREIPERLGGALIGGAVVYSVAHQVPMVSGTVGTLAFGVAAWKAGKPPEEETPEDDQETAGEGPEEDQDQEDAAAEAEKAARAADAAFIEFIESNIAYAAQKQKRKGVHTKSLLALLHAQGMLTDWDEADLRSKIGDLGITVRRQLNIKGSNGFGIHIDDLARDLGRTPRLPAEMIPDHTPGAPPTTTPSEEPPARPALTLLTPPAEAA